MESLSLEFMSLQVACIEFLMSLRLGQLEETCVSPLQLKHSTFFPLEDLSNLFPFLEFCFLLVLLWNFNTFLTHFSHMNQFFPTYTFRIFRLFFLILRSLKSELFKLLRIWKCYFIGMKRTNKFINSHRVNVLAFLYSSDFKTLKKGS